MTISEPKTLGLPPEKRAEIIAALRDNPNAYQVAKTVGGVSHSTVWNVAQQAGVALTKMGAPQIPAKKRAAIIAALRDNPNACQVAKTVGGVSRQTVWNVAKQTGIALTQRGAQKIPAEKRAEVIAALKDNPNTYQVAEAVGGVSRATVYRLAKENNIATIAKGKKPRVPDEKCAAIITAFRDNPNARQVADTVGGVSSVTVLRLAKRNGVAVTKRGRPPMPDKKRAEIIAALRDNPNARQVAQTVGGVSHVTVCKMARKIGVKLAPRRPRKKQTAQQWDV